jgi:hypothetical protein
MIQGEEGISSKDQVQMRKVQVVHQEEEIQQPKYFLEVVPVEQRLYLFSGWLYSQERVV